MSILAHDAVGIDMRVLFVAFTLRLESKVIVCVGLKFDCTNLVDSLSYAFFLLFQKWKCDLAMTQKFFDW